MFKKAVMTVALAAFALPFAAGTAAAAEEKKLTPQQERMRACNKDAADKKGDERKAFMKECLSAKNKEVADKRKAQQEKMKSCNKDAGDKKGADRKKFMSECLKG